MAFRRALLVIGFGLASLGISGCSKSGPELTEVTGTITLDGRPLPRVGVVFRPVGSTVASPAYGGTDPEGKYVLMFTRDSYGAMPGDYEVDLEVNRLSKSEIAEMKAEGQEVPEAPPAIPKKYRAGTLKAKVEAGKKNVIDFALDSK